jgi:tetratricopeptide (TPR) repeat protein
MELKYGATVEQAMDQAMQWLKAGRVHKAYGAVQLALAIDADFVPARLLLAQVYQARGDDRLCQETLTELCQKMPDPAEQIGVWMQWAGWTDTPEESLERLTTIEERFVELGPRLVAPLKYQCYLALGDEAHAERVFVRLLNIRRKLAASDLAVYRSWLDTCIDAQNWRGVRKVRERLMKHLARGAALQAQEVAREAQNWFQEAQQCGENHQYRAALAWLEGARVLDPTLADGRKRALAMIPLAQLEGEWEQILTDVLVPPPLTGLAGQEWNRTIGQTAPLDVAIATDEPIDWYLADATDATELLRYLENHYPRLWSRCEASWKAKVQPLLKRPSSPKHRRSPAYR